MLATKHQFENLVAAFRGGTKLEFSKGEYVIRPGDTPPGVFYIERGLIKAYDITKYGDENLLIVRKEQEIFPLIWAIIGQERQVIYEAITPATLWRISRKDFLDHVQTNSESLSPLLDITVEMYRIHSERIMNLEYRTVRERLISFLLTMAARFGTESDQGILIDVPLRRQDMASSISASREATGRALTVLEKQGLISTKSLLVTLHDEAKLRSYLSIGSKRKR